MLGKIWIVSKYIFENTNHHTYQIPLTKQPSSCVMNIHQSTELDTTLLVSNKPEIWWWWSLLNVTNMEACANRILKIVFVWRLLIYPYVVSVVDTDTGQCNKSGEYLCLITYPCIAGGSYSGPVQSTHCHHQKPQQIIISQKWRKLKR